jgi:hypothetical protein
MKVAYGVDKLVFLTICLTFFSGCTSTSSAISTSTNEKLYYYVDNEYKELFLEVNDFSGVRSLYYLDGNGKMKHEITEKDPNVFTEYQKWDREQGTLSLSITPTEIYEETEKNVFQVTISYDLKIDESTLQIELLSGHEANKYTHEVIYIVVGESDENSQDVDTQNRKIIENKVCNKGRGNASYNVTANIEIISPYIIVAYFKNKDGETFATQYQKITVKEPKYMLQPIPNVSMMQEILLLTALAASQQAESDFKRYASAYGYAVPYLNLRELLISVASGSLRNIFAMSYPLTLSNECNDIIDLFNNPKNDIMTVWEEEKRKRMQKRFFLSGCTG